jgi:DNA-binding GntR family transcriptional regulator
MTAKPPSPIFRTKREVALDSLQNAIRLGHYAPGQPLRQFQLVKDLGVGSTPVREAVLELLARGILVQESHRSVRVAELDLERLRNIYRVRALLETEAARVGTARISDQAIEEMRLLLRNMIDAKRKGDIEGAMRADFDFRALLYAAAENPVLVDLIEQSWNLFPGSVLWNIPGRLAQSIKEHRVILDAVARRDPTAAAYAIEHHLLSALAALEAHVSSFAKRSTDKRAAKAT